MTRSRPVLNGSMVSSVMGRAHVIAVLLFLTGCPASFAPHTKHYQGDSETERKYLAEARRDVYPDDVRKDPDAFRKATLAWPGVVVSVRPSPTDPVLSEILIQHHYWDWLEDHSIQKAKAFLSPRGEGQFLCHAERRTIPVVELKQAMAIAYVRPVGMKDQTIHAACMVRFFPRQWYATDVMEYGRGGEGFKMLRVPME